MAMNKSDRNKMLLGVFIFLASPYAGAYAMHKLSLFHWLRTPFIITTMVFMFIGIFIFVVGFSRFVVGFSGND